MAELTINEIVGAVQVIDLASSRGAFRGEELLPVGTLREKLAAYAKAAQEASSSEPDEETA